MSAREAQRLLRPVATPYPIREINVRPGVKYLEYEYRRDPFGVDYLAGFLGRPGKRRLVAIGAFRPRERTREGIRVGMPASRIFERYRARVACMQYISCRLGPSRRRHILFVIGSGSGHFNSPNEFTPRVTLILAREGGLGIEIPGR